MDSNKNFATHEVLNQSPPFENINLFTSDKTLTEIVTRVNNPTALAKLTKFGEKAGSAKALLLGRQANENPPKLKTFDQKGHRIDMVEYHPAYHQLMSLSMEQGLHCSTWQHLKNGGASEPGAHVFRCAGSYMAAQMEAGHCCPITMTHAAVATLVKQPTLSKDWLPKILSTSYDASFKPKEQKKSVTLGMGMTEKQGGTDVRANTTQAVPLNQSGSGSEYLITGHKWFLSAPMSDAFFILAQAPAGLSCFLVPRFLPDETLNAIYLQRLKDKLGNRSNASTEVEFNQAHGWLVGDEGRGVSNIIDMVTYTRLDCAISSAGLMRLALANAIHHTSHRSVFQKKLIDQPLMTQVLADLALDAEATTQLAFRLAHAFDQQDDEVEQAFKRLLTPIIKYWICKIAPAFTYEAMECLGGNGYVEEGLLARVYREVPVNAIWEGSGNVMCLDVLRVLQNEPGITESVFALLDQEAAGNSLIIKSIEQLKDFLLKPDEMETNARNFVEQMAITTAATILQKNSPPPISDAYIKTRLVCGLNYTYGSCRRIKDPSIILESYK